MRNRNAIAEAIADISAQQANISLATYLGGTSTKTKSGISLGIQKSTDYLIEKIHKANEQGYQRIKFVGFCIGKNSTYLL